MRRIKPYISYRNVGDINPKNMCDDDNILLPVIYFRLIVKLGNKLCSNMSMENFMLSHLGCARKVFHDKVIFFTWNTRQVTRIGDALRRRGLTSLTCLTL